MYVVKPKQERVITQTKYNRRRQSKELDQNSKQNTGSWRKARENTCEQVTTLLLVFLVIG